MSIPDTWRAFRRHSDSCVPCSTAVDAIRSVISAREGPVWGRGDLLACLDPCCPEGKYLALEWDAACQEQLNNPALSARSRALGTRDDREELRRQALMELPMQELQRLEGIDPELREAEIHAVVRAYQRKARTVRALDPDSTDSDAAPGRCVACGRPTRNAHPDLLCNACWRSRNGKR